MLYNQPYGVSDPDAAYINGNPATGTMGSIPPAASIEHPQREIVNVIKDGGLNPSAADLRQMSKAIQSGRMNYCQDAGTPNFIAVTPVPPLGAYAVGQYFRIRVAAGNTGPVQINASNLGWKPVVHADLTPMLSGELHVGQMIEVGYDGANWQMLTGNVSGTIINLTAPQTFFCNAATGSDTLYDGSQAAVDAPNGRGPFKSLRKALTQMSKYNLAGFDFTIQLADGTYTETAYIQAPIPNGSGKVYITGNKATPSNVLLTNTGTGSCLMFTGGYFILDGVSLQSSNANAQDSGHCLSVSQAANVWVNAIAFYHAPACHMLCGPGGSLAVVGPISIYGGAATAHQMAFQNGTITFLTSPLPTLTIVNAVTIGQFAYSQGGGQQVASYYNINNIANVTGSKYLAMANGVIDSLGRGISYLPGTTAGAVASGGQYV